MGGSPPPGGVPKTIEIDVLRLKQGYNPQVGDILNPAQIDDLYEVKTSAGGKINALQKDKLKAVTGDKIKIGMSPRRYTQGLGWHNTPRVTKIIRILGLAGLATAAVAIVMVDSFDDEVDTIIWSIASAKMETDPLLRKVAVMQVVQEVGSYLSNFDPTGSARIVTVGKLYDIMGQGDW